MLITIIKYFAIIFCSFYIYLKLLHIRPIKKTKLSFIIFIALILPVIYLSRKYAAPLSIYIMISLFVFFVKIVLKTSLNLSLIVSAISFAIAYSIFLTAAALMYPAGYLIALFLDEYPSDLVSIICIGMLQLLLTAVPFRFKRLKNGMPFLYEYGSSDTGVYISISLLLAASLFGMSRKADLVFIIPVFFSLICGLALLFWWKNSLTQSYIEKVKINEIEELKMHLHKSDRKIEQLKSHNYELSKIIHKDNKLIPAMVYTIKEYLFLVGREINNGEQLIKAKELLAHLEGMLQERSDILEKYEIKYKILSATNVLTIDALLSYMFRKAAEYQISFDLSLSGSVKYMVENIISELDMRTLLADLIENAIIATKNPARKNIMIHMGITGSCYCIDILDSGIPFTIETLLNLGIKQTTTHTNEGGSGIGLMTAFDIIKKYRASFIIEDFVINNLFTKKVSVCFDDLEQYRINTMRICVKETLSNRADIIFVNNNVSVQ